MALGKKTGGRQKGTPNKGPKAVKPTRAATLEAYAQTGELPLDYMLRVMREATEPGRRDDMAKAAAPYLHPRLSQVESKSEVTHRYVARVPAKAETTDTWQKQHAPPALTTTTH